MMEPFNTGENNQFNTNTMRQLIIKALGTNKRLYDDFIFHNFVKWASHHANRYELPILSLTNNSHVWYWYMKAWCEQVEQPFVAENREYLLNDIVDPETFNSLFNDYPPKIINTWPSVLLDQIRTKTRKEQYNG